MSIASRISIMRNVLFFLSGSTVVKNLPPSAGDVGSVPGSGDPLEKGMVIHSVFLPRESHGHRSPVGYSPWGCKESDTT